MSQKIEIGVSAKTGGAEDGIRKIATESAGAAEAVDDIGSASESAARRLGDLAKQTENMARATRELARAREMLQRETGRAVSKEEGDNFLTQFYHMRNSKAFGAGKAVLQSSSFEDWLDTYQRRYVNPRDAEAHKRRVVGYAMPGAYNFPPPPGGGQNSYPPGGGFGGGGGGRFGGGGGTIQRAQSSAIGFGKTMLGLAGISGLASMAGQAADLATQEAIGLDTLKRRAGDLGVDFDDLRSKVRAVGDGMGFTYVESVRLSQEYAKITGQFKNANGVRTAEGFSRAFGIDGSSGVEFFASMQRMRAPGSDDQGSRRLALMIGEAVSKGGYGGKADEVLSAVSGLATEMTRNTLAAPNISAIAGYLTALTKSGYAGLDPSGAAALLSQADATMRRGGGMGDASLNFSYAALSQGHPGMDVVQAGALWQAGIFGTTRGVFGKGSPVGDWYRSNGLGTPGLDDTTNLSKQLSFMHRQYGGNGRRFMLDAIKNQFGLSYSQAAAIDLMNSHGPENLTESARLVGAAGLDISKLSATGMFGVGRIAAARSRGDLKAIYGSVMGRGDVSSTEKSALSDAFGSGNDEKLKEALTKIIATHDQEKTEGSETRQAISDLKDAMTNVGTVIVGALNPIREAVSMVAEHLAPQEWKQHLQDQKDQGKPFNSLARDVSPNLLRYDYSKAERMYAAMGGGYGAASKVAPKPSYALAPDSQAYNEQMALYKHMRGIAGAQGLKISDDQRATILQAAGGDKQLASMMEGILRVENRGQGIPRDLASPQGALGFWQMLPGTFAENGGGNIHSFSDGAKAAASYLRKMRKKYKGNIAATVASYDGGTAQGNRVADGLAPTARETQEYLGIYSMTGGAMGNTPLPTAAAPSGGHQVQVSIAGEVHLPVKDASGAQIGTAKITPFISRAPSGSTPVPGPLTLPWTH